jgi:4'-phosphopantetheinyl transferase
VTSEAQSRLSLTKLYWLEQTCADVPPDDDWLRPSETACLNALRIPKRRTDWRLGRWTAKRAVSICLNAPGPPKTLAAIEIRSAASGAPEVFLDNQPAAVTISLSHSNGTALCAVAPPGTELGCDLEIIEPRSEAFVADYFTSDEQVLIARASDADRLRLSTLFWSAKESALKALREGLRLDTRSVTVSLTESVPPSAPHEMATAPNFTECRSSWHPLQVHCASGQVFHGWWGQTANLLQTVVAAPAPARPIQLQV